MTDEIARKEREGFAIKGDAPFDTSRITVAVLEPGHGGPNLVAIQAGRAMVQVTPAVARALADYIHVVADEAARNEKKQPKASSLILPGDWAGGRKP